MAHANAGNFDAFQIASPQTDPDPNSYIYPYLDTAGSVNRSGYSNPRLDYVLANALRATTQGARVDYRVAQQIMHEDRPIIVLRPKTFYGIFDSNLKGIQFALRRPASGRERAVQVLTVGRLALTPRAVALALVVLGVASAARPRRPGTAARSSWRTTASPPTSIRR